MFVRNTLLQPTMFEVDGIKIMPFLGEVISFDIGVCHLGNLLASIKQDGSISLDTEEGKALR